MDGLIDSVNTAGNNPTASVTDRAWFSTNSKDVLTFLTRLRRTPLEAWHRCAEADRHVWSRSAPADADAAPDASAAWEELADQQSRARLREALETMPDAVRRIRQRIDSELTILDGMISAAAVSRMRRAARLAACAVAVRQHLSPEDFARLYRPFAELIPLDVYTD